MTPSPDDLTLPPEVALSELITGRAAPGLPPRVGEFAGLIPSALSPPPMPIYLGNEGENGPWFSHVNNQRDVVAELGVSHLERVIVSGSLYLFHDDRMISDGSEPGRVARRFAGAERLTPERLMLRSERVVLDPPALIVAGPGYPIWGHWLLDFLPRLAIALETLKREADRCVIPLPDDTPGFVYGMIRHFCGIGRERVFPYSVARQSVLCREAYVPSFAHNNYFLHPWLGSFYQRFIPALIPELPRRFCVSRRGLSGGTRSVARQFLQEDVFEAAAERAGIVCVSPETMPLATQIALFAQAELVLGVAGSGMHNTIFARPGTWVGQVGMPNSIQPRIAALGQHNQAYLLPDSDADNEAGVRVMSVREDAVEAFVADFAAQAAPG